MYSRCYPSAAVHMARPPSPGKCRRPDAASGTATYLDRRQGDFVSTALVPYSAAADTACVPAGHFIRRTVQPMRITRYPEA